MKDVMIDIESFGNRKNSVICQIGACYFDRHTGEIGKTFKVNIDARSAIASGAEMDGDTIYWWLNQSDEARQSILADPKSSIQDAFIQLNEFLKDASFLWSHATFDFVAIMETYKRLNIKPALSYRSARDIRTLIDLAKVTIDKTARQGVHHDGLADALHQVKYCVEAFNKLNRLKKISALFSNLLSEFGE